jgi:hypothetical protein
MSVITLTPVTITASTSLKKNVHKGTLTRLSAADGLTATLPAATGSGDVYPIAVATSVTSNGYIIAALGTDILAGVVSVATDVAGVTCPTTATSDKMTLNGGTTGGLAGSKVTLTDIASGVWMVEGSLISTGAEATPFSAT